MDGKLLTYKEFQEILTKESFKYHLLEEPSTMQKAKFAEFFKRRHGIITLIEPHPDKSQNKIKYFWPTKK